MNLLQFIEALETRWPIYLVGDYESDSLQWLGSDTVNWGVLKTADFPCEFKWAHFDLSTLSFYAGEYPLRCHAPLRLIWIMKDDTVIGIMLWYLFTFSSYIYLWNTDGTQSRCRQTLSPLLESLFDEYNFPLQLEFVDFVSFEQIYQHIELLTDV